MTFYILIALTIVLFIYQIYYREYFHYYLKGKFNLYKENYENAEKYLNLSIKNNQLLHKAYFELGKLNEILSRENIDNFSEPKDIYILKAVNGYFNSLYYSKRNDKLKVGNIALNRMKSIYYSVDDSLKQKINTNIFTFITNHEKPILKSIYKNEMSDILKDYLNSNTPSSQMFFNELNEHIEKYYEKDSIKKFDFEKLEGFTINELKEKVGISSFNFIQAKDKTGDITKYLRHWEEKNRIDVVIKQDLLKETQENPIMLLSIFKNIKKGQSGYYTRFKITEHSFDDSYTD